MPSTPSSPRLENRSGARGGAMEGLVTGGTGTPGRVVGVLETGAGIAEAVRGVDAVMHAASRPGHDVAQARVLLDATRRAEVPHLVFVSIVGVDRVPLRYYRDKVEIEGLVAASGVPWTVLRASQFHDLL